MKKFAEIQKVAEFRKGGSQGLMDLLPKICSKKALAAKGDDRFLAMMAKAINQAGFSWKVIEKKWPQFEEAFFGFDIGKLVMLPPDKWEAYTQDARVVRNWQKIQAVRDNTYFIAEEANKHGSFATFIAEWPETDQIGLMAYLKKHGSRLGGQSALWFLRYVGKDCFIPTRDVVLALQHAGVDIPENPTAKRDLKKIQEAFNSWQEESGLPFTHISKIAAYSVGENYPPSHLLGMASEEV